MLAVAKKISSVVVILLWRSWRCAHLKTPLSLFLALATVSLLSGCDPVGRIKSCPEITCGDMCGMQADGCGGTIDCGACQCQPATCDEIGAECGTWTDGCGGSINCGACPMAQVPVYLMAGQSNMIGTVDINLFNQLVAGDASTVLTDWYGPTQYQSYAYDAAVIDYELAEFERFKTQGLLPLVLESGAVDSVQCRFQSDLPVVLQPSACGSEFGPELMAAAYLRWSLQPNPAALAFVKVAKGGTTQHTDWKSPSTVQRQKTTLQDNTAVVGPEFVRLLAAIADLETRPRKVHSACTQETCRFEAFIWFQGENDAIDADDPADVEAYRQGLVELIADVRTATNNATLPVVLIQIGHWAQSFSYGPDIAAMQAQVAQDDANVHLVVTDDLSRFYHYDPIAQLIIGDRVGRILSTLLAQ